MSVDLKQIEEYGKLAFTPDEVELAMNIEGLADKIRSGVGDVSNAFNRGNLLGEAELRKGVSDMAGRGSHPAQGHMAKLFMRLNIDRAING